MTPCSNFVFSGTSIEEMVKQILSLSLDQQEQVMFHIGRAQTDKINDDLQSMKLAYRDISNLTNIDVNKWINDKNCIIRGIVNGVAGKNTSDYVKAKAIESVYHVRNTQVVLPLSFSEAIVEYSITNSKLASNLKGASSASGHYQTQRDWLTEQASTPLPPVSGDIVCAFDNDQVIGKHWHVRANQKLKSSVITTVAVAEVNPHGKLQEDEDLKPGNWTNQAIPQEVLDNRSDLHKRADKVSLL